MDQNILGSLNVTKRRQNATTKRNDTKCLLGADLFLTAISFQWLFLEGTVPLP